MISDGRICIVGYFKVIDWAPANGSRRRRWPAGI